MQESHDSLGSLRRLAALVAVRRTRHVTDAAASLGVPQPTLSRSLARLADEVGAPLLERDGRGIRLTRHGELLAEHADRALRDVEAAVRAIRADVDPMSGEVRVGFQHTLGTWLFPQLVHAVREQRPSLRVRPDQDAAEAIIDRLEAGALDLVMVAPGRPVHSAGVVTRTLGTQPLVVVLPSAHLLATRPTLDAGTLADEPWIVLEHGYGLRTIADGLLASTGHRLEPAFECQEMATACGLVAAGLGITVAPVGIAPAGTVEVPLVDDAGTPLHRRLDLLWTEASAQSPAVRFVRDVARDVAPALLDPRASSDVPPLAT